MQQRQKQVPTPETERWFEEARRTGLITCEVFTHRLADNKVLHYNVTWMLRDWINHKIFVPIGTIHIDKTLYDSTLQSKGIEEPRVRRLCEPYVSYPVVMVDHHDGSFIIDGNHRIVRRYRDGLRLARVMKVPESVWCNYLVHYPPQVYEFIMEEINAQTPSGGHQVRIEI